MPSHRAAAEAQGGHPAPCAREREMFRLRASEGLSLREIGERFDLHGERVRQLLVLYFGLAGIPPAAKARRRAATARRHAEDLARAQARADDLVAAWRNGEETMQLAVTFSVSRNSVERVIRYEAGDADRAARADALRRSREGKRAR